MTDWMQGAREIFGTATLPPSEPRAVVEVSSGGNNPAYAEAALLGECETIMATVEGGRNAQLNKSAYKMGGYIGAHEISETRCRDALVAAGLKAGLEIRESVASVESGLNSGKKYPTAAPPPRPSGTIEIGPKVDRLIEEAFPGTVAAEALKRRLKATTAAQVRMKRVRWLWHDRIPLGEITLVAGREGVGKSTYLADLAAKITKGEALGEFTGEPRSVIYMANEDSWAYTIVPRMVAAGADLDRIIRVDVETEEGPEGLILPKDCMELADLALEVGAAALMCDPIISLVDDRLSTDRARELRQALEPLRKAAERADCAVPALVHFNKGDGDVLTRISGSRGWVEVARAAVGLVKDKEAGHCVLSQIKNNLGRMGLSNWAYRIVPATVQTDDGPSEVGKIEWIGKVEQGVEDLMEKPSGRSGRPAGASTNAIVEIVLANGEVSTEDIYLALPDIDRQTVLRALATATNNGSIRRIARGIYGIPCTPSEREEE